MKRLNSLPFLLALAIFACSSDKGDGQDDYSDLLEGDIEQFLYQDVHYKIVRIGSQIWFAENLSAEPSKGNSWCYGIPPYCDIYGRLYDWEAANNVCPSGWRLPSKRDYNTLLDYVDSNSQYLAGHVLKSSHGWSYGSGPDIYNFSVLPAGYKFSDDTFLDRGKQAFFWISLEGCPYYVRFATGDGQLHFGPDEVTKGFSVRCVKK